jgi:CBS domain-containing protein
MDSKTHDHSRLGSELQKGTFNQSLEPLFERDVVCLTQNSSAFDAAMEMLKNHVGDVVVTDETNGAQIPIGIVTDRDIVIHSIAKKRNPETVKLSEIMTSRIVTAFEEDDIGTLVKLMTEEGIGRLPIVDRSGALVGILSAKRLYQYLAQSLCELSSLSVQQQSREEKVH